MSLVTSCGLKAIWMILWEKGSLMGHLEHLDLLDNLCNAIQTLKHLKGALKVGRSKGNYRMVMWVCQNEYGFIGRSTFFLEIAELLMGTPSQQYYSKQRRYNSGAYSWCIGNCLGLYNEKKKTISLSFCGRICSSFNVSS